MITNYNVQYNVNGITHNDKLTEIHHRTLQPTSALGSIILSFISLFWFKCTDLV